MAGPIGSLSDPFNQTSLNTAMWTQSLGGTTTMSYATTGATVTLPSTATSTDRGTIASSPAYDLRGSSITLHVITVPNVATTADGLFWAQVDGSNYFAYVIEGGTLYGQIVVADVLTTVFNFAYSSSTHAYWRISELAGVATWWTSTNGITWTSRGTYTHGLTLTDTMKVVIWSYCWQAVTSPGTFKFNLLNSGPLMPQPFTKQQAVNRSYTY